eukprot:8117084-Lingulodinium_polyedra.AAC.1
MGTQGTARRRAPLPWRPHASDAAAVYAVFCREVIGVLAPLRGPQQRQPWLSLSTMPFVQQRASLRRHRDHLSMGC